jgi:hypothetical protein
LKQDWIGAKKTRFPQYRDPRYLPSPKAGVQCKCPKCGQVHETLLHWAGRGMPRIYCGICRPQVASLCDTSAECGGACFARSARKSGSALSE